MNHNRMPVTNEQPVRISRIPLLFVSALGLLCALSGCEIWLDVDAPQCKDNKTCVGLLGRGYTCGPAGVCVAPAQLSNGKPDAGNGGNAGSSAGDAATGGSKLPARWACLENPPATITPDRNRTVHVQFDAVDFTTLLPPAGLTADACGPVDIECKSPLVSGATPDADGFFAFDLPYAFSGYFKLTAPDFVPAYQYTNRPAIEDAIIAGPALVTPDTQAAIATHSADDVDLGMGFAIIEVRDCDGKAGDGVHLENKEVGSRPAYYFDGALPSRDLTATVISTSLGATREPRAVGGFYNLTQGYNTFEATLASTGTPVAKITTQIRSGYITYIGLYAGY